MGDFNKKYIIKQAENILQEYDRRDQEEKKMIVNLQKDYKKTKKINLVLKIIVAIMAISIIMLAI